MISDKVPTREELEATGRRNRAERIKNYPAVETATLRDLFAGFALAGMLANSGYHFDGGEDGEERAAQAYSFADSMLDQREQNRGQS